MGLLKETIDDTLAEITVLVIIHLQDLLESALIDEVLDIRELGGSTLGLEIWSASDRPGQGYRCCIPPRPWWSQSGPCC